MQINFSSSLDPRKSRIMDSVSDNIEVIMGIETDNFVKKLFKSFFEELSEKFGRKNVRYQFCF